MKKQRISWLRPSVTLSAGTLTQLLAAFACFLGAFVLPLNFVEFQGIERRVLVILGFVMLTLGLANLLYGRHLSRLLSRAGKRSRVVIPREGIGYLAIMLTLAVGALLGRRNMPLLVFGMMAGPFILNGAIVYHMLYGITVTRRLPRSAVCGDFVTVELEVANSKRLMASHMLEVRDQIESSGGGRHTIRDREGIVTFVRIPAGSSRLGRYQAAFAERGRYSLGPVRVSSRFPLGIGERGQVFNSRSELLIHPRPGRLQPAWTRRQKELAEATSRTRPQFGVFDDEFHRIREYRSDDNPRSIHWRSTARRGQLMVREYEQQRHADSLVILDLPENADWTDEEVETAVSLAATVCLEQTRSSSGSRYVLGIAATDSRLIASRSPAGFREEALDALAVCQPSAAADLHQLLEKLLSEHSLNDERIILITPRPDDAVSAIATIAKAHHSGLADLSSRTTIVRAESSAMNDIFRIDAVETAKASFEMPASPSGPRESSPTPEEVSV